MLVQRLRLRVGTAPAIRDHLRALSSSSTSAASSTASASTPQTPAKVPVSLIAALRKTHPVPLAQAREALERSNLDLAAAVAYLSSAGSASAQKKAEKVAGRSTDEGAIAVSLLGGKRVAMVHLACETDFVARNDVFLKAARGIAETCAFLDVPQDDSVPVQQPVGADPVQTFPVDALLSAPLIAMTAPGDGSDPTPIPTSSEPQTVRQVLLSSLAQTGENLKLLRAISFAAPFPSQPTVRLVPGAYTHGGSASTGKVGGIVVLRVEGDGDKPIAALISGPGGNELDEQLRALARNLARQVVGFPTRAVSQTTGVAEEETLLSQTAMMLGSEQKVADVLTDWSKERGVKIAVVGMRRWSVSDEIETPAV